MIPTVPAEELFLDQEERYEIFTVKAAERPHLVSYQEEQHIPTQAQDSSDHVHVAKAKEALAGSRGEEKKDDAEHSDEGRLTLPLVDGCDLPGWRRHRLAYAASADEVEGMLNIGVGSTLFRRADQLSYPCRLSRCGDFRTKIIDELAVTPPSADMDADIVDCDECSQCNA